jgi:hypothetical protein
LDSLPLVFAVYFVFNIVRVVLEVPVLLLVTPVLKASVLQNGSRAVIVAILDFFDGSIKCGLVEFLDFDILFDGFQVSLPDLGLLLNCNW